MNRLEIKDDGKITKGELPQAWARHTDDGLQHAEGKHGLVLKGRIKDP